MIQTGPLAQNIHAREVSVQAANQKEGGAQVQMIGVILGVSLTPEAKAIVQLEVIQVANQTRTHPYR